MTQATLVSRVESDICEPDDEFVSESPDASFWQLRRDMSVVFLQHLSYEQSCRLLRFNPDYDHPEESTLSCNGKVSTVCLRPWQVISVATMMKQESTPNGTFLDATRQPPQHHHPSSRPS